MDCVVGIGGYVGFLPADIVDANRWARINGLKDAEKARKGE